MSDHLRQTGYFNRHIDTTEVAEGPMVLPENQGLAHQGGEENTALQHHAI